MKRFSIVLSIAFYCNMTFSQDAHFSQFNATRLYTNPAFAGTDSALVISAGYRNERPKFKERYQTFAFSTDQYVDFLKGGLGVSFIHDGQMRGLLTRTSIDIIYSPEISLAGKRIILKPAIQIGYFRNTIDLSRLTFGDMIDARRGFVYDPNTPLLESKSGVDFSTGLLLYTNHFHAGTAVSHITQPDQGFVGPSSLPIKVTLHTGANLNFKNLDRLILFPGVLWQKQQDFQQFIAGVDARYKMLLLGISYRMSDRFVDAPIAMIGVQCRLFKLSYTFDYTLDLPVSQTGGSHEVQLSFFLHHHKRNVSKVLNLI